MKTQRFLTCCLLLMACAILQAKEKTIERPAYIAKNTTALEIEKIVLSDTATVLHMRAYHRPNNWIKISAKSSLTGNNGVGYPIRCVDGFPVETEYYMPESGEKAFRMIFPPLPDDVQRVDFSEGIGKQSWCIWGIEVKGNKLPKLELPAGLRITKPGKNTTLPAPQLALGKATLKGQLLEYRPGMEEKLNLLIYSPLKISEGRLEIDIAQDGSFAAEVPVATATPAIISFTSQSVPLFLAPGEETTIYLNQRELSRAASRVRKNEKAEGPMAYYAGYMADVSNELIELGKTYRFSTDYEQLFKDAEGKTIEELRDNFLKEKELGYTAIDALKISPASKAILKGNLATMTVYNSLFIEPIFRRAYVNANQLNDEERQKFYNTPLDIPADFLEPALNNFTEINSPELIYCMPYADLLTALYKRKTKSGETNEMNGLFFDLGYVAGVMNQISDFQPATDEQFAKLNAMGEPVFVEIVNAKNQKLMQTIEANKKKTGFKVNEAGEVANEDLFASIIAPFRGKAILVDLWATWCGPCVMANKTMKPMKEELAGKDVVFLYITGESSPKGKWENMIADISGEHYRLNDSQWDYLLNSFETKGIPTYIMVDKEGNISYKQIGFPGVEKMKEEIEKLL